MAGAVKKTLFFSAAAFLLMFTAGSRLFPGTWQKIMPYRFYYVLTNSMEPMIPTNSLVCVKTYHGDRELEENEIITFYAVRFGEKIMITHRFSHTELNEHGETIYRTHPEQSDTLDVYETTRDDILGTYLFHIPSAGKIILFLRSKFGILWVCQMVVILCVRELLAAYWEEREKVLPDKVPEHI